MKFKQFLIRLFTRRALIIILKTLDYNAIVHLIIQAKSGNANVTDKVSQQNIDEVADTIIWAANTAKQIPLKKHQ